jgi:hypothetical protein
MCVKRSRLHFMQVVPFYTMARHCMHGEHSTPRRGAELSMFACEWSFLITTAKFSGVHTPNAHTLQADGQATSSGGAKTLTWQRTKWLKDDPGRSRYRGRRVMFAEPHTHARARMQHHRKWAAHTELQDWWGNEWGGCQCVSHEWWACRVCT